MTPRAAALLHPAAALLFLTVGLALRLGGLPPGVSRQLWMVGLLITGLPVVFRTARGVARGVFAADLVAALAIVAALLLIEPFAGLIVTLMQTGGEALERRAEQRATSAVRELEAQAPRMAHRISAGQQIDDVPAGAIRVGEHILVRPGEMVPCDGTVIAGRAAVDIARVTGEPVPLDGRPGVGLRSGSLVLDGPLTLSVSALAGDSLYAQIVEQVRTAQASKAPLQRVADRVAVWFTPVTLVACALAWGLSGDATRVLAVLVVATPCPLILATPVAIVGGINRAARHRIIIRHGGALEALARVTAVVFDKTGTLTLGQPDLAEVVSLAGEDPDVLLALAAAVEVGAGHPLGRSIVRAAEARGLAVPEARDVRESPGRGVAGSAAGRRITVGARSLLREAAPDADGPSDGDPDGLRAYMTLDGRLAAILRFADRPRPGVRESLAGLRRQGVTRTMLLSGDHSETALSVASTVGLTEAAGDLLPADKVAWVRRLQSEGHRVMMVGDGINDAPALSAADVGVALAAHGGGITAEAADVVLLEEDVRRAGQALVLGRETMHIARQSLGVGLGLSAVAMVFAALGHIPPAAGALLQEGIDLAVILNALRAARSGSMVS